MGGAILCRDCDPVVRAEMDSLRAEGKTVNTLHIAKRIFRETHSAGNYLLRDIPDDLWKKAQHRAVDEKISLRDLLLKSLHAYLR
ncbi:MAG: hypothetical protein MUC33_01255 [Desulfobacterales bacterium]|jgi:hypothetical protein|nr:hypothetical protein [Desulfobacterales bacterium]